MDRTNRSRALRAALRFTPAASKIVDNKTEAPRRHD